MYDIDPTVVESTDSASEDTSGRQMEEEYEMVDHDDSRKFIRDVLEIVKQHAEHSSKCERHQVNFLIGSTGSGKSTTTNFLCNRNVVTVSERIADSDDYETQLMVENPLKGCEIGHGGDSLTRFLCLHEDGGLCFCDTPGFEDTEGDTVDVANAIAIGSAMRMCESARLILIIPESSIMDRGNGLAEIFQILKRFLKNGKDNLQSVVMLFTKNALFPNARKIQAQIEKLSKAQHFVAFQPFLTHTINLLKTHKEMLLLKPASEEGKACLPDLLRLIQEAPAIIHPMDVLTAPLSDDSSTKIALSCRDLAVCMEESFRVAKPFRNLQDDLDDLRFLASALSDKEVHASYNRICSILVDHIAQACRTARTAVKARKFTEAQVCLTIVQGFEALAQHYESIQPQLKAVEYNPLVSEVNAEVEKNLRQALLAELPATNLFEPLNVLKGVDACLKPLLLTQVRDAYKQAATAAKARLETSAEQAQEWIRSRAFRPKELSDLLDDVKALESMPEHVEGGGHDGECCSLLAALIEDNAKDCTTLLASNSPALDAESAQTLKLNLEILARCAEVKGGHAPGSEAAVNLVQNALTSSWFRHTQSVDTQLAAEQYLEAAHPLGQLSLLKDLVQSGHREAFQAKVQDVQARLEKNVATVKEMLCGEVPREKEFKAVAMLLHGLVEGTGPISVHFADGVRTSFIQEVESVRQELDSLFDKVVDGGCRGLLEEGPPGADVDKARDWMTAMRRLDYMLGVPIDFETRLPVKCARILSQTALCFGELLSRCEGLAQIECVWDAENLRGELDTLLAYQRELQECAAGGEKLGHLFAVVPCTRELLRPVPPLLLSTPRQAGRGGRDRRIKRSPLQGAVSLSGQGDAGLHRSPTTEPTSAGGAGGVGAAAGLSLTSLDALVSVFAGCVERVNVLLDSSAGHMLEHFKADLECEEFEAANVAWLSLDAMMDLQPLISVNVEGLSKDAMEWGREALSSKRDVFESALRLDQMEEAAAGLDSVRRMQILQPMADITSTVLEKMESEFHMKTSRFNADICELLTTKNFQRIHVVMKGHRELEHNAGVPNARREFDTAQQQIVDFFKPRFEVTSSAIQAMSSTKRVAEQKIFEIGETLRHFSDASDLINLFGVDNQLSTWGKHLRSFLNNKIVSIQAHCCDCIRNLELRGYESSVEYLESLQLLSGSITAEIIDNLDQSARTKINNLQSELTEAIESGSHRKIDKIFAGMKKAQELSRIEGISLSNELDDLHTLLESRLKELCGSIQTALNDNNIKEADDLLGCFNTLLASEEVKNTEYSSRVSKFLSEMKEIKEYILTPRMLREDPEKIRHCLEGFKKVDKRFYERQCATFLDKLKSEVESCALELSKRDVEKLRAIDLRMKDLKIYEVALGGLGFDSEIAGYKRSLFDALVDTIQKTSEKMDVHLAKSRYEEYEELKSFYDKALPVLKECDLADAKVKNEFFDRNMMAMARIEAKADSITNMWTRMEMSDLTQTSSMEPQEFAKFHEELEREERLLDGNLCRSLAKKDFSAAKATQAVIKRLSDGAASIQSLWTEKKFISISTMVRKLQGFSKVDPTKDQSTLLLKDMVEDIAGRLDKMVDDIKLQFTAALRAARSEGAVDELATLRQVNVMFEKLSEAQREFLSIQGICPPDREESVTSIMYEAIDIEADGYLSQFSAGGSMNVDAVVAALAGLWTVPSEISNVVVKKHAKDQMRRILRCCKESGACGGSEFNFTELAAKLTDIGAKGGEIVEEFVDVFKAFRAEKFRKATARMTVGDALDKLLVLNKLKSEVKSRLQKHYGHFDREFQSLMGRFYNAQQIVKSLPKLAMEELRHDQIPAILANIFAVWSVLNSGQDGSYVTPHPVQVLSIFCLLGMCEADSGKSDNFFINLVTRLHDYLSHKKASSGHLVQLKTGEGKSLVLGVLSALLALFGLEVDCVCYSAYLSSRDEKSFAPIFDAYEISDRIHYGTFSTLSTRLISQVCDVREGSCRFVSGELGGAPLSSETTARKRILLIDEVDVFFSEEFYGKVYSASVTVKNPQIEEIQNCVWLNRSLAARDIWSRVTALAQYKDLTSGKCAHVMALINRHVEDMIKDVRLFEGEGHEYEVSTDGRIVYAEQDTACSKIVRGYMTLFAHFKEYENGKVSLFALHDAMGLHIKCGNFSFAEIPRYYDLIMGVTGTLETLTDFERSIIEKDYNIRNLTLTPSIYGNSRLQFREGLDVHVETDAALYNRKVKEEIVAAQAAKRAVLVFFETEKDIDAWRDSGYADGIPNLSTITRYTPNVDHYVVQATRPGSVTLMSAIHGRGLDFVCHDRDMDSKGGVHVVQAFLSEQLSEEQQIKGRTARQDKKGTYSLVLCAPLLEKFSITPKDLEGARKVGKVYELLNEKRVAWFAAKATRRKEAVECAKRLHDRSREFQDLLLDYFRGGADDARAREVKRRIIQSLETLHNVGGGQCRLLCLSDATGSMKKLWQGTKDCIVEVLRRIEEVAGKGRVDLRWMAFRDYDQLASNKLLEASEWTHDVESLIAFLDRVQCFGGAGGKLAGANDYEEAVEAALAAANSDPGRPTRVLLFGDMPPHPEKKGEVIPSHDHVLETDWELECNALANKNIPVHTFQIGDCSVTRAAFGEIAKITGGLARPFKTEDMINAVCLQALDQVGGLDLEDKYRERYMGYTFSA